MRVGDWRALVRKALVGTRLLDRVVTSLFKRTFTFEARDESVFSFLLLKPTHALMLAGIRCAGAGGGGPGH
jgi:hypothetical protein